MLPDSIASLHNLLKSRGIDVLLAGGWAVNEHGFARETRDIDWIARQDQKDLAQEFLKSAGFRIGSDSNLVTRFLPQIPTIPTIDLLWVDSDTFEQLNVGKTLGGRLGTIPVLSFNNLIALKVYALKDNEDRDGRDLMDIRRLLRANPGLLSEELLRSLCDRYGPPGAYDLIKKP